MGATDSSAAPAERLTDAERARRWQASATKAQQDLKAIEGRIAPLRPLLDGGADGALLKAALDEYQVLANDPTIGQALRKYRETGSLSLAPTPAAAATADEFMTATEQRLHNELTQTQGLVSTLTQNMGVQSFKGHVEEVFGELGLSGELADKTKAQMEQQVSQWARIEQTGAPGEREAARKALMDMQRPDGRGTVEMLVTKALGAKGMLALAEQKLKRQGQARAGMATDSPLQVGTTGDEPAPRHKRILDAIRTARTRPEVLGRYPA